MALIKVASGLLGFEEVCSLEASLVLQESVLFRLRTNNLDHLPNPNA